MLELKIDFSLLKNVVDAFKDFTDQAAWVFSKKGLEFRVKSKDVSRASFGILRLENHRFFFYQYRGSSPNLILGVDFAEMSKMLQIMNRVGSRENNVGIITMKAQENIDQVEFYLNAIKPYSDILYQMPLVKIIPGQFEIEKNFNHIICQIRMQSSELAEICEALSPFGTSMRISCEQEGVEFSVNVDDQISKSIMISRPRNDSMRPEVTITNGRYGEMKGRVSSSFSCHHLNLITKAKPLCDEVILSLFSTGPLIVEYCWWECTEHDFATFSLENEDCISNALYKQFDSIRFEEELVNAK